MPQAAPKAHTSPRPHHGMQHPEHLEPILSFLAHVGIQVREGPVSTSTFLPGLEIQSGVIHFDRARLAWPGDLLHEAGHLAVLPAALRSAASGDLTHGPATPHAGEMEAMAWSFAAAHQLGLPLEVLFHEGGYHGRSEGLRMTFSNGVYPGLASLCASGMAEPPIRSSESAAGSDGYPRMRAWLRG